jgi:hypothetical protein
MGTLPTKICRLEAICEGYPADPPGLVTRVLCDGLLRHRPLGLRFLIVPDASPKEISPTNGQPIDKAYRSRTMRIIAPVYFLVMLGNLIWAILAGGPILTAAILFAGALLGLVRLRWPKDTWPVWLFSYKP